MGPSPGCAKPLSLSNVNSLLPATPTLAPSAKLPSPGRFMKVIDRSILKRRLKVECDRVKQRIEVARREEALSHVVQIAPRPSEDAGWDAVRAPLDRSDS